LQSLLSPWLSLHEASQPVAMSTQKTGRDASALPRTLGTFDIVLLNVAAIIALRWLAIAAQAGPSSLMLWTLGMITFFLPSALTVLELSSRLPGEGGIYIWSKAAFGDLHAFIVGWTYWIANLVFLPSLLIFIAGIFLYVPGGRWLALSDSSFYNAVFCVGLLWFAVFLNVLGLKRAKWLQNIGGIATWVTGAIVLGAGGLAWYRFGLATPIDANALKPDLRSLVTLGSFSAMAFAYSGLELGPILGGEIKDPRRTIARAMLITSIVVPLLYISGTAAMLAALPSRQINLITGIPQALQAVGTKVGVPHLGRMAAALLTLSQIGTLGAWMSGTARLPFLFGLDRYLPRALAAVHPRFGSPHIALLTQGLITTLILLSATSNTGIHEAFVLLIDMSIILVFIPLLYMFAALPILRRKAEPKRETGVTRIPGGPLLCWLVAGSGMAVTALGVAVATVPPVFSINGALFSLKVVAGPLILIAIGLIFYFRSRPFRS
jgi:glutamate:GABA antiporter